MPDAIVTRRTRAADAAPDGEGGAGSLAAQPALALRETTRKLAATSAPKQTPGTGPIERLGDRAAPKHSNRKETTNGKYAGIVLAAVMIVSFAGYAECAIHGVPVAARALAKPGSHITSARDTIICCSQPAFPALAHVEGCHTINLKPLHVDCIASFDQFEPVLPE